MMSLHLDEQMMTAALELARQGQGRVEPNPMVGAAIAQGNQIVGQGWHQQYGGAHAEVIALQQAGQHARGATLYVTLEPCCHQGKTPPCTDAIIKSGIQRVVAAMTDPFPQVSGKGVSTLQAAGVQVDVGIKQSEAEQLNRPYVKLIKTGLPYVIAKWAMTLDGKIATATGQSKWISGPESRSRVHELRGRIDGILVGIGTVMKDDPLLTARPSGPRTPCRIVLDHELRIPLESQLVRTAREAPALLVHTTGDSERIKNLTQAGCECLPITEASTVEQCRQLMTELGRRRMTNLLVEGGPRVLGSFLDGRFLDEIWAFIAPKWIGDAGAPGPIAGQGIPSLDAAHSLEEVSVEQVGADVLLRGICQYHQ